MQHCKSTIFQLKKHKVQRKEVKKSGNHKPKTYNRYTETREKKDNYTIKENNRTTREETTRKRAVKKYKKISLQSGSKYTSINNYS